MSPLVAEMLGVLVRALLMSLSGVLVEHHILTADQSDRFSAAILQHLMMAAPMLLAVAWGLWARYKGRLKFLAALDLPAGSTEADAHVLAHAPEIKAQAFDK